MLFTFVQCNASRDGSSSDPATALQVHEVQDLPKISARYQPVPESAVQFLFELLLFVLGEALSHGLLDVPHPICLDEGPSLVLDREPKGRKLQDLRQDAAVLALGGRGRFAAFPVGSCGIVGIIVV